MKISESIKTATTFKQARLPMHTGPLPLKFMHEITLELEKDEGLFPMKAVSIERYHKLLTFTRKNEALLAAKKAQEKGFPGAFVCVVIAQPPGEKRKVYVISNVRQQGIEFGALLLTKEGYKKLMAFTAPPKKPVKPLTYKGK